MTGFRDPRPAHGLDHGVAGDRVESLYDNGYTRVFRVWRRPGGDPVIRKEVTGPGAEQRRRHELSILRRLSGVEGVPQVVEDRDTGNAIETADPGGAAVAQDGGGPAVTLVTPVELVRLARDLARILAAVHARGVMHRDINPANVLLAGPEKRPVLIDFDLATTFAEERPDFVHHNEIVGTLPYVAPEQTGRTGRPVDQRADLYGLGATLYALGTGRPPFDDPDPARLIRDLLLTTPAPPIRRNAVLPPLLSDIVMRLLEKEPDRRYQSAAGLAYDLARLDDALRAGGDGPGTRFDLGANDFPARLLPPSRLVGRRDELAALHSAFDRAIRGEETGGPWPGVMVTGPEGVGKSALVDELRTTVAAAGGWFVTGKADRFRSDQVGDPVSQVVRCLGRLLLAEPEDSFSRLRDDLIHALGGNAGLLTGFSEEFAVLLEVPPEELDPQDPAAGKARMFQLGTTLLRTLASPSRPLVMFLDDLHWATSGTLGFVDSLITGERIPGLLLICAYRELETGGTHPLPSMLSRWIGLGTAPMLIELHDLPGPELGTLLGEMLRLPPDRAAELAELIGARTAGNPYDTVELVNALRRDGVLVQGGAAGWQWDARRIEHYVGSSEVADLLANRIAALPAPSRDLLGIIACLGGQVDPGLLRFVTDLTADALTDRLLPALEDGLLVIAEGGTGDHRYGMRERPATITGTGRSTAPGEAVVRFRYDRVQQAAAGGPAEESRRRLHLTLARRLVDHPEWRLLAAEQYLRALPAVTDPVERRRVAELFGVTASRTRITDLELADRLITAAIGLLDSDGDGDGHGDGDGEAPDALAASLDAQSHALLYDLGRHDEADAVFERIRHRTSDPLRLAGPVCVQVVGLSNRARHHDALDLGLAALDRLGVHRPDDLRPVAAAAPALLREWAASTDEAAELSRPELSDPASLAAARLLARLADSAYAVDPAINTWLALECHRLWSDRGPCPDLLFGMASAASIPISREQDTRTGYTLARLALSLGEGRGYTLVTSWARLMFAAFAQHWFEPLEECVVQARLAREGLLQSGDLQGACYSYSPELHALLECAADLEEFGDAVDTALAFAARTGNTHTGTAWSAFRQLTRCLRGATAVPGAFDDDEFDEADFRAHVRAMPIAASNYHLCRALAAAVFGDQQALDEHATEAMALQPITASLATAVPARMLHALSLVGQVRSAGPLERTVLIAQLTVCRDWLADRVTEAPSSFGHLVHWVEAERAWALGDGTAAALEFDQAQAQPTLYRRPWQVALLAERTGRFYLERGLEQLGGRILAEARCHYLTWGATAKVTELDREFPGLPAESPLLPAGTAGKAAVAMAAAAAARSGRCGGPAGGRTSGRLGGSGIRNRIASRPGSWSGSHSGSGESTELSNESIDLHAVLSASQALSSETGLEPLRARVTEILRGLTGADEVQLLLWNDARSQWFLPRTTTGEGAHTLEISADDAAEHGMLPLSAIRYVQRTSEPLLVEDATRDDRFSADPYFAGLDHCSLLVVPIVPQGAPRALLLLENRLTRGAFTISGLDTVQLIAGQLAVSLGNALLYGSLEQKVAERTAELQAANQRLERSSTTDPLTGLLNRGGMAAALQDRWLEAAGTGHPLALALIEVDGFKLYTDRHGLLAGDGCLRKVADAIHANLRGTDLAGRHDGDEFTVLMPGTDAATARALAEHIRKGVRQLKEPHGDRPEQVITVSVGVASQVPTMHTDARRLVEAADAQLSRAKRSGRDQVAWTAAADTTDGGG